MMRYNQGEGSTMDLERTWSLGEEREACAEVEVVVAQAPIEAVRDLCEAFLPDDCDADRMTDDDWRGLATDLLGCGMCDADSGAPATLFGVRAILGMGPTWEIEATVDGETTSTTLAEFLAQNGPALAREEVSRLLALRAGESTSGGSDGNGTAPWTVWRVE